MALRQAAHTYLGRRLDLGVERRGKLLQGHLRRCGPVAHPPPVLNQGQVDGLLDQRLGLNS
jgi:hypothetical protein